MDLNFSKPTIAIIAALSPHNLRSGKTGLKLFLLLNSINLCGDNAAMIAMVGLEKFKLKQFNNLDYPAKPRWPLDENAIFLKGAGIKL